MITKIKLWCKMKQLFVLIFLLFSCVSETAQDQIPRLSPKSFVGQTVGYTDVIIRYGSPGVKGRTIWGELVPFDQVWRAGANEATTMEFSNDVFINNNKVPAGRYSFFVIPSKSNWTIIFNKIDEQWGSFKYDAKEDLFRFSVNPQENNFVERLRYIIEYKTAFTANIILEWEKLKIVFEVNSNIEEK